MEIKEQMSWELGSETRLSEGQSPGSRYATGNQTDVALALMELYSLVGRLE